MKSRIVFFSTLFVLSLIGFLCVFTPFQSVPVSGYDWGTQRTDSGIGCNSDCIETTDGNIWRVGLETVEGGTYDVVFGDMHTESIEDDVVLCIVYHRPDGSLSVHNL